jgi:hypothetical protein
VSDWTEQSLDLWRTYSDAQKELWNTWLDAADRFGAAGAETAGEADSTRSRAGVAGAPPPWGGDWTEWADRWQELARKTLKTWTTGAAGVPSEVVDRLFSGEEAFLQFLDLSLGGLKVIAPKIDAGEHWEELLRRYLAEIREGILQGSPWFMPEGAGAVAAGIPELWTLYVTEMQRFVAPWAEATQIALLGSTDVSAGDRESFARAEAAFMDAFDGTFGRYAAAPSVGSSRELNERMFRGFEAWVAVRRAAMAFQTQMVNTGFGSYEDMLRELVEKGERGETVTSLRQLFNLWLDMAERGYAEMFKTDDFAELQAGLVNATMQYQMRQREIQEEFLSAMGQPTRSEIDQVHRHVYDLRIEVRYMKRELAALRRRLEAQPPAAAPPAGPPTVAPEPAVAGAAAAPVSATSPALKKPAKTKRSATKSAAAKPASARVAKAGQAPGASKPQPPGEGR